MIDPAVKAVCETGYLPLAGGEGVEFDWNNDLLFLDEVLPYHPNAMRLTAFGAEGVLFENTYYSIGGGFVLDESEATANAHLVPQVALPYDFNTAVELLELCQKSGMSISQLMLENEKVWRSESEIRAGIGSIWQVMQECVANGLENEGILPGGLKVRRRAPALYPLPEAGHLRQRDQHHAECHGLGQPVRSGGERRECRPAGAW